MRFRKLAVGLSVIALANTGAPTIKVFANEFEKKLSKIERTQEHTSTMEIFTTEKNINFKAYEETFRTSNNLVEAVSANGGKYASSTPEKAIDGDISTHWETGTPNSETFINEFTVTFKELVNIDKMTYKVRQDSGTKGFLNNYEIYASKTIEGEDFTLVTKGSGNSTRETVQVKFNEIEAKRIKIRFVGADANWASMSEIGFYKKDVVKDAMDNLFTDSSQTTVNEEYKDINKLEELEKLAKEHPFYSDYKTKIEDAKIIVENNTVASSLASTKQFKHYNNSEYNQLFKMDNSNIESIKNNAGHYSSRVISNAIDEDLDTYWETNKSNSSSFINEVEVTFKERVVLDRIMYGARQNDTKGFAEEFEIYASKTSQGDTYQLVSTGQHTRTKGLIEAKFNPTEFKRIKFKFKKSNQNWATINEFAFYKKDKLTDEINSIFVDEAFTELKEEYKDIDKINELEAQAIKHPLKAELIQIIDLAKEILEGNVDYSKTTIIANQHGNMDYHAKNVLALNSSGQNFQATGLYALPGDKITVYVDVDTSTTKMPALRFTQNEGSWRGWAKTVILHRGKNEIIVPNVYNESILETKPKPGGAILIDNPYTAEEQGRAPKIRFEGAERFPFFKEGDNEEEFKSFLIEYKKKLDEDNKTGANKVLDILAVESDRMLISGTATGAYDAYITKGVNPSETTTFWDYTMEEIYKYYGLDGSSEIHDPKYLKEHMMFAQPFGYMYAWTDHIGVQKDVMSSMLNPSAIKKGAWGFIHETGHRMDTRNRIWGEVTNNMLPMYMSHLYGHPDKRIQYDTIYKKAAPDVREDLYVNGRHFESLGMFWQLQLHKENYWSELNKLYRERRPNIENDQHKMDTMIEYSSEVFNKDLTEYFYKHGFRASEETKYKLASKYDKLDKKVWYLNDTTFNYKGKGITKESKPNIDKINIDGSINISSSIDKEDLLGYEIIRNNKVIGFTASNTYKDDTKEEGVVYKYQVVAYGKDLSVSSISEEVSSLTPNIKLAQTKTYLGLGEKFEPLNYAKALSYNEEDLTDEMIVTHNVDTSKKGEYTVTYSIKDNNITTETTMKVEVVSNIDYLSDIDWQNVETQYGKPRKNTNIKGRINGDIKQFEKGIGIHANGKIEYNLEGTNYDNFEALLGVDTSITANVERASVSFKILGDGEVLATTKVLNFADDMVYINVPIKNVKNLTIEVYDGGNGNGSDHTVIANPKLTNNNMKPSLEIESSVSVKFGQTLENIIGKISAIDKEDGDITDKVVVSGHKEVNFNKPGEYKINYSVTDTDGNTSTAERIITVVDMRDFNFLTNYEWSKATQSYSTTKKDLSVSGKKLRLTSQNGSEVVYDRGIGAHANATITYDLSDKNYEIFTSYIGVDREMYNRIGSVSFEVHVDGKVKYDSGLMKANDPHKFVEVDINGAKELKLVVKDGGNGIGSDHASWGDTKLHFVNTERADLTNLKAAIKKAEALDFTHYTEESVKELNSTLAKVKKMVDEEFINEAKSKEAIKTIDEAIKNLVPIDKVVVIEDKYLQQDIKRTLNIGDREIKLADMHKLVTLNCESGYVKNLKGIEYAVNLENLNIDFNEVKDISPINKLHNLKNFSGKENFISKQNSEIVIEGGKFIIEDVVIDASGERLLPTEVVLNPNTKPTKLDLNKVLVGNKVVIDTNSIKGTEPVEIMYKSKTHDYQLYSFAFLSQK